MLCVYHVELCGKHSIGLQGLRVRREFDDHVDNEVFDRLSLRLKRENVSFLFLGDGRYVKSRMSIGYLVVISFVLLFSKKYRRKDFPTSLDSLVENIQLNIVFLLSFRFSFTPKSFVCCCEHFSKIPSTRIHACEKQSHANSEGKAVHLGGFGT